MKPKIIIIDDNAGKNSLWSLPRQGHDITWNSFSSLEEVENFRENILPQELANAEKLKLVINFHSTDEGRLWYFDKEIHPAVFVSEALRNSHGNHFLCEIFTCFAGAKSNLGSHEYPWRYDEIPENSTFIIHAGHNPVLSNIAKPQIARNISEADEKELFLDAIIFSPETKKFLSRKNGELKFFKFSAPKPKRAQDLSDEKIAEFLANGVDDFLRFYDSEIAEISPQKKSELAQKYKEKITPETIVNYRNNAFLMEVVRISYQNFSPDHKSYLDFYLQAGVDPNYALETTTALQMACAFENPEMARYLTQKGCKASKPLFNNCNSLHTSIAQNLPAITEILLESEGGNVDLFDTYPNWHPLHYAFHFGMKKNDLRCFDMLLQYVDINHPDKNGVTLLQRFAPNGNKDELEQLVMRGADLTVINEKMLMNVVNSPKFLPLLEARSGKKIQNKLAAAVKLGFPNLVKNLVEQDKEINVEDFEKAVATAEEIGQKEMLQYLLNESLMRKVGDPQQVENLINKGANPNYKNLGKFPLYEATKLGATQSVKKLVEKGADPAMEIFMGTGTTALSYAKQMEKDPAMREIRDFLENLKENAIQTSTKVRKTFQFVDNSKPRGKVT